MSYIGIRYIKSAMCSHAADEYFKVRVIMRETARKQRIYVRANAGEETKYDMSLSIKK